VGNDPPCSLAMIRGTLGFVRWDSPLTMAGRADDGARSENAGSPGLHRGPRLVYKSAA
jgi:hypothetical protein